MQRAVSELEHEFPEQIVARNVDATTPDSKRDVRELGFHNHGLVIRSPDGRTLWSQPDHEVDMTEVRTALRDLLTDR